MLRLVHIFDIKPGVPESSFIEWLDSALMERSRKYGCLERKTWLFLDGLEGTYEKNRPVKRPRYLHEAFWENQEGAEQFRKWLLSEEANEFRRKWFGAIQDHTVLRYVDFRPPGAVTDD
ncbi:MAG: hypothetical protein ACE5H0_03075 [Bacteroidota bacterium]